jgi:methyl-accepting chemotaxis protein
MNRKNLTIRRQFLVRILSVLIIIALISGALQLYFMNEQIVERTNQQAEDVANNVLRGIQQTDLANKTIEHQIDLKLLAYSSQIAILLHSQNVNDITPEELIKIRDTLGLAGITLFQENKSRDDIVGTVATEKQEKGFSFKKFGYYEVGKSLLNGKEPAVPGATYTDQNTLVLPIAQSGSHTNKPEFFKYAYYHVPGTNYIINPYIKANEVYNYTEIVGPNREIKELIKKNNIVQEIAVLNPRVFVNPALEKQLYPPVKKIEAGTFSLKTKKDIKLLTQKTIDKESYIENVNGKKVYKMFVPIDKNRVIYIALDYGEMIGTLYSYSIILIVSGLISLFVLFLLTARFFNRIYDNMQKINDQIKLLAEGDLTAKSRVNDGSELERLSQSTNRMVDQLNKLVMATHEQAKKTQRLSLLLEAEASHSVEKMVELSTETTLKSRDHLYDITDFLDEVEQVLQPYKEREHILEIIEKADGIRQIVNERSAATTDTTITLSDLLKSLYDQSSELSDISNAMLEQIGKFKL